MRYILIHKTDARWEAGDIPSRQLIDRVGALIGQLKRTGQFVSGEGLRATSQGVRVKAHAGKRTVTPGPYVGENELTAAFTVVCAGSLEEAVAHALQQADVLGDVELDVRPVTEPWDIGLAPKPDGVSGRRYMVLRKASPGTERGTVPDGAQSARLKTLREEATQKGTHVGTVTLQPSARGRRYKNSVNGSRVTDGPFAESKELIAGYMMITAESAQQADHWAREYLAAVEADEVDLCEVQEES